jgi:primary-amine oxidase
MDWSAFGRVAAATLILGMALTAASVAAEDRIPPPEHATHPMDGLTAGEITVAARIMRAVGKLDEASQIVSLSLEENSKDRVRNWKPGSPFERHAFAVILRNGVLSEARIDLGAERLVSWKDVPNRQAALTVDEFVGATDIVKSDSSWRAAMAKRGITNLDNILCFPLAVGPVIDPALAGRRLLNVPCVDRSGSDNNLWGKPIENLLTTIDTVAKSVLSVSDLGVLPAVTDTPSHAWENSGKTRRVPKPVMISAPDGSNVAIEGGMVRWDKWSFHVRLDPRLGAVLSLVRYGDGDRLRDVVYELSASEMFVPYMDPAPTWSFRSYMDIGEYGFGLLSTELRPGRDCPSSAEFLDLTIADPKGQPVGLKGVVCIFERPTGDPLWRHDEVMNGTFEERANTELVVRMAPVVGNYDYLVDYVFDRAGDIDVKVGAYGIDAAKGVASSTLADPTGKADTAYGTLVGKRIVAVNHDHYMSFRIDMDVDGTANRLVEDLFVPRRISSDGARRSIWQIDQQTVATEGPVTIPLNAAQFRVESTTARNAQGYSTSYQLMPGHGEISLLAADDPVQARAGFSAYALWVTAFSSEEKFAAGSYPNENSDADGLPKWVAAKRPIDGRDLVLWYTVGFRHVPRAEEWPAMPGVWHGFRLRPFNFFDRSPAMDVPPEGVSSR